MRLSRLPRPRLVACVEHKGQHAPGVPRVDDPVIHQPRAAVHRLRDDLEGLRKALDCACLVITRSREGIVWRSGGTVGAVAAYCPERARNVSGAGDSLMAAFALALASGADFGQAAVLGNLAGGLAAAEPDIAAVRLADLTLALDDGAAPMIG